jgi:hypothetical protein
MFLIVNPEGCRHMVLKSFQDIAKLNMSKLESGTVLPIPIIDVNNPGKYDLVLTYIRESVSGTEYLKGVIIGNPNNTSYDNVRSRSAPVSLFSLAAEGYRNKYKGVKYDIVDFFPADMIVNGHIPMKKAASTHTALDNWDELMSVLNEAFADKSPEVPMGTSE